jgi:hypothetical protein
MSELSPKARALVQSGKGAFQPSAADRERIQNALRAHLGTAVPPTHAAAPVRPGRQLLSGVIGTSVMGGALFLAFHHAGAAHPAPIPRTPVVATQAPRTDAPSDEPVLAPSTPAAVLPAKPSASRPAQDSLAREVALLSRATSDLHSGRAAEALKVLGEHWRQFPHGLLAEERRAARAQALCALGRMSEAQAELDRLTPQSPAAARARQVCGAAAVATPR